MKPALVALACAGIALLPMQSLAERRSDAGGSEPTIRSGSVGTLGDTVSERTGGELAATIGTKGGVRPPERTSELNTLVEAQDKVLQQKLRSICRGC